MIKNHTMDQSGIEPESSSCKNEILSLKDSHMHYSSGSQPKSLQPNFVCHTLQGKKSEQSIQDMQRQQNECTHRNMTFQKPNPLDPPVQAPLQDTHDSLRKNVIKCSTRPESANWQPSVHSYDDRNRLPESRDVHINSKIGHDIASWGRVPWKGDWSCPDCEFLNFAKNKTCKRRYENGARKECGVPKPVKKGQKPTHVDPTKLRDVTCAKCGDSVFKKRNVCRSCHTPIHPTGVCTSPRHAEGLLCAPLSPETCSTTATSFDGKSHDQYETETMETVTSAEVDGATPKQGDVGISSPSPTSNSSQWLEAGLSQKESSGATPARDQGTRDQGTLVSRVSASFYQPLDAAKPKTNSAPPTRARLLHLIFDEGFKKLGLDSRALECEFAAYGTVLWATIRGHGGSLIGLVMFDSSTGVENAMKRYRRVPGKRIPMIRYEAGKSKEESNQPHEWDSSWTEKPTARWPNQWHTYDLHGSDWRVDSAVGNWTNMEMPKRCEEATEEIRCI